MPNDSNTREHQKNPRRVAAGKRNRKLRNPITPKGRAKLRETALEHKPWERSTGPRSTGGKRKASSNANKERSLEERCAMFTAANVRAILKGIGIGR